MGSRRLQVGVIGIEHLHLFEMIDGLLGIGAETVCHAADDGPLTELYEAWRTESQRRSHDEVITDQTLDLIVTAAVPSERAKIALDALATGHYVLAAKPAVLDLADLAEINDAVLLSGLSWWVFFSERLTNRAITDAVRRVHAGEIGELVAISGLAPHTLAADSRPEWFFDPARAGGILADVAAHQADQLLALAGPGLVDVRSAEVRNVNTPQHPQFQDVGRMSLHHFNSDYRTVMSDHRVDWLSPAGLGTWGDVRLMITGTTGTIEVRSNIDAAGQPGGQHLIITDADSTRRIDTSEVELDWPLRLVTDIATGSDDFMNHRHVFDACSIVLHAQRDADEQ